MTQLRALGILVALLLGACGSSDQAHYQGWVEADLLFIAPDDAGRVERLAVRTGDMVAGGAALFTVDTDIQESDMRAGAAAVAEAKARLARLEAAQQRPAEVAVLEAQLHRVEASLKLSTAELERQQALASRGIAAAAQLDTARANNERDRAMLEEIRGQIVVAKMASREEEIVAARQALAAAEAKQAANKSRLERRMVTSPVAGVVQQVYYRVGEVAPAGKPVLSILPEANVKIRFYIPQAELPRISIGQQVAIRCDGCTNDLTARVEFIARSAEFTPPVIYSLEERAKLVFLVEARPERPQALRVGQPVQVAVTSGKQ
jgi:HlyD family secretion protein